MKEVLRSDSEDVEILLPIYDSQAHRYGSMRSVAKKSQPLSLESIFITTLEIELQLLINKLLLPILFKFERIILKIFSSPSPTRRILRYPRVYLAPDQMRCVF